MVIKKTLLVLMVSLISTTALVSCSDSSSTNNSKIDTPPAVSEAILSGTATIVPTEIAQVGETSAERQAEIITNVNAFINAEGQYSEAELRDNPYWFELDVDPNEPLPLGFMDPNIAQAILVDYLWTGDVVHLFMGTYDTDGNRIVIDYPTASSSASPTISESQSGVIGDDTFVSGGDQEKYLTVLENNVGNPFYFWCVCNEVGIGEGLPQRIIDNINLINSSLEYARDVFNLLNKENIDSGDVIEDDHNQNDDVMSVNYFDKENQMDTSDFGTITAEEPQGLMSIVVRNP